MFTVTAGQVTRVSVTCGLPAVRRRTLAVTVLWLNSWSAIVVSAHWHSHSVEGATKTQQGQQYKPNQLMRQLKKF
jgi:hypothetical protein